LSIDIAIAAVAADDRVERADVMYGTAASSGGAMIAARARERCLTAAFRIAMAGKFFFFRTGQVSVHG
jgi:hypothetical protein